MSWRRPGRSRRSGDEWFHHLVKRRRALRLGGFALFGVSLGKLFVYDLAALSSITRALSFLAVGAFLLVGGFFYQRLSAQLEERDAS